MTQYKFPPVVSQLVQKQLARDREHEAPRLSQPLAQSLFRSFVRDSLIAS